MVDGQIASTVEYEGWHKDVLALNLQQIETLKSKAHDCFKWPELVKFYEFEKQKLKQQRDFEKQQNDLKNYDSHTTKFRFVEITQIKS